MTVLGRKSGLFFPQFCEKSYFWGKQAFSQCQAPITHPHSEKITPARGDITIMMHEKQNELTDISVARCSAGTI